MAGTAPLGLRVPLSALNVAIHRSAKPFSAIALTAGADSGCDRPTFGIGRLDSGRGRSGCRSASRVEWGFIVERDAVGHATTRRRGGLPPLYVAVWVVLSSMALTYLGMLSLRPDLAESLGQQVSAVLGTEGGPVSARYASDERARAEIVELRRNLDALGSELNAMRRQVSAREERDQAVIARLAAIEAQKVAERSLPLSTASIDRAPAPAGDDPQRARVINPSPIELQPAEPPTAASDPARRDRARDERIAAAPEPPQAKAPPPEPTGPRGIQIATGPSVDALRISWMLLAQRHNEVLRKLEPRFVPSTGGTGPAYRLIAGPIESTAAANKVCSELRARRVTCGVSAFGGEPL